MESAGHCSRGRPPPRAGTGFASLLTLLLFAAGASDAMTDKDRERLRWDNTLPVTVPMPQATPWAKPYSLGTVRMLFITSHRAYGGYQDNYGGARVGVELRHRFDLDGAGLTIPCQKYRDRDPAFDEYAVETARKPYDCYVLAHLSLMQRLPEAAREAILQRIRDGAGLVVDRFDAREPDFLEGVALAPAADGLAGQGMRTGMINAGRVVVGFPALPPDPFPQGQWEKKLPTPTGAAVDMFEAYYTADLYYEKCGRAVLWAAGKEPKMTVSLEIGPSPVSWRDVTKGRMRVQPLPGTRTAVRLRSAHTGTAILRPAVRETEYVLPAIPAGRYFVDAIATSERGVEAWAAADLVVTADDRVGEIALGRDWYEKGESATGTVGLELSDSGAAAGPDRCRLRIQALDKHGRVLVEKEYPASASSVAFSLLVEQFLPPLTYVRAVLIRDHREVAWGISCFTVPQRQLDEWHFTMWGVIGGRHGGAAGPAANRMWLEETLARHGVTARIATNAAWPYMTNAGMTYAAFTGGVGTPGRGQVQVEEDGTVKGFRLGSRKAEDLGVGCPNDEPAVRERLREVMQADSSYTPVAEWRPSGVLAYMWPDEVKTRGACLHPACWQAYQNWLQEQYGSIEALNASWEYDYRSFAEIKPTVDRPAVLNARDHYADIAALNTAWSTAYESFDEILPSIDWTAVNNEYASVPSPPSKWEGDKYAVKEGAFFGRSKISYPRYFDRIAFQYANYANHARRWTGIAQELDPKARVGISAPMSCLDDDLDTLVLGTGMMMVYSHLQMDLIRGIGKPGYLFGTWAGYAENAWNRNAFWQSFLRGATNNGWWHVHHFLESHLEPGSAARFVLDARPVFDGLGTLLNVRSRILHDGIVMLDSFPSAQASKLEAGYSYGTWDPFNSMGHYDEGSLPGKGMDWGLKPGGVNHFVWHRAVRALGLQFRYVTEKMIHRGEFHPHEYRVMILSQCEAIGPKEAVAIRGFVRNGGTAVADIRPGLYDGHCKPQENGNGILDDLFGVRHTGNVPAVATPGTVAIPDLRELGVGRRADESLALELPELHVNPAVEVTSGRALGRAGDTPILIVNRVGKGRAILLNFPLCTYPNLSLPETPPQAADLLAALFAGSGVRWPFEMETADGRPHRNVAAVRWRVSEDTEVVALYGPLNANRSTFPFNEDHTLYRIEPWTGGRDASSEVHLKLPERRCVTVLGAPGTRRPVREFSVELGLWQPTFLVLSRRVLRGPTIKPEQDAVSAAKILRLRLGARDRQGPRVLKLQFTAPDGTPAPWFDRNVIVPADGGTERLRLAHNEQPGTWGVTVTDLCTGLAETAEFRIE